ncbi:hypothetical protein O3M35_009868 [Rhynocoris fuscipes]|uniref:Uncharacterized protein n=1 Tax=Rhynocoris fuscipes TaxID=488301 RepID=A0AAW1D826_9HEMI
MSKEECQPHHRTPWSKVKCIIHHHSKGASRKRTSCNHLCEKKNEKWRTLSEEVNVEAEEDCMLVKGAAPKLTVSLPSSEELRYEKIDKKYEVADNPNASEISPPLVRKSKWLKVRDVFLQGSRSAPTSPVRSDSFAYDLESDEVSSGEILGDKDDEVFDDNENLRYEIEASYIELQNRLTEEFTRKMEEIAHNSDIKQRLKKTSYNNRSVPQEVIVPTSTGLFRFEGISDKFTRKLYEWEVIYGFLKECDTFYLKHNNGIVKSKSIGSLVDLGNSNQEVIAHHRTSSLSLNDVDIQASRLAVINSN